MYIYGYTKKEYYTLHNYTMCNIISLLPSLNWKQKGGEIMDLLISFILSVTAGVVAYYICKWLDEEDVNER